MDALRLRDLETGQLVAPAGGYPRIVPYNPEAGEHVIAFQPADDLAPCRWYEVETTDCAGRRAPAPGDAGGVALPDQRLRPRDPAATDPRHDHVRRDGLVHVPGGPDDGLRWNARARADRARAGELRRRAERRASGAGSSLPIARGVAELDVTLAGSSCAELTAPSGPARIRGRVRWLDAQGKPIGVSFVKDDDFDVRGDVVTLRDRTRVFPSHALALRIAPDLTGCGAGGPTVLPIANGKLTAWPR